MQSNISATTSDEIKNLQKSLPDRGWSPWLYINLDSSKSSENEFDLLLTITFSKHHIKIYGGRMWFGLKGGELKLQPENGVIPEECRWPQNELKVEIHVQRTISESSTLNQTKSSSDTLNAKASMKDVSASMGISEKKESGEERTRGFQGEFKDAIWQVITKGSPEEAYWDFEVGADQSFLQGRLNGKELGKLIVHSKPCALQATFKVFKKDIVPLEGDGIWPDGLAKNKRVIIQAILRNSFLKKMGSEIYSHKLRCD